MISLLESLHILSTVLSFRFLLRGPIQTLGLINSHIRFSEPLLSLISLEKSTKAEEPLQTQASHTYMTVSLARMPVSLENSSRRVCNNYSVSPLSSNLQLPSRSVDDSVLCVWRKRENISLVLAVWSYICPLPLLFSTKTVWLSLSLCFFNLSSCDSFHQHLNMC